MSARRTLALIAWLSTVSSAFAQAPYVAPTYDGRGAAAAFTEPPPGYAPPGYALPPYAAPSYPYVAPNGAPPPATTPLPPPPNAGYVATPNVAPGASYAAPVGPAPTTPLPPVDPMYTTGPTTPIMSDSAWGEQPLYVISGDRLLTASNDLSWYPGGGNSAAFVDEGVPAFPDGEEIPAPGGPDLYGPAPVPSLLPSPAEAPSATVESGAPPSTAEKVDDDDPIVFPAFPPSWVEFFQSNKVIQYWSPSRLELGGTQTGGTKDSWTLLTRGVWNRESDRWKFTLEGTGRYTELNNVRSADEWIVRNNVDLKSLNSPWLVFGKASGEYDAVERVSPRVILSTGAGYRFLDEKDVRILITRIGPTLTYERYYSPFSDDLKPELLVEVEGKFAVGRMTLEHLTSVYPGFANGGTIRLKSTSGLLLPLDVKKLWSAKLGFVYNYNDNTNSGVKPYDYESSFSIVYNK